MFITKKSKGKRIVAEELIEDGEMTNTVIEPEATELLFETEDVADLVSEVTGETVEVSADETGDAVTFTVGDEEYTVEAEGTEDVLESVKTRRAGKRAVAASRTRHVAAKRPVKASTRRTLRRR